MGKQIKLPTFHPGQAEAFSKSLFSHPENPNGRLAIRCGRRWGKTDLLCSIAVDGAAKGEPIGWFAPSYRIMSESYRLMVDMLYPIIKSSSKVDGVIHTTTGGRIDTWTLNDDRAGRSRYYKKVLIDEGAFTEDNMLDMWEQNIAPTLLDLNGTAIIASNTNGIDPKNFLYAVCHETKYGFAQYHAPSSGNPHVPRRFKDESEESHAKRRLETFEKIKADNHPLVYAQEYLADFVDWSGVSFFTRKSLTIDDKPVSVPNRCDAVFAVIDSATKTGTANDGTGVTYFALSSRVPFSGIYKLVVLDWDLIQIEGSLLEEWLPSVFDNLEAYAKQCNAQAGSLGAFIEDKSSGMVLNQQVARRGWPARPIDSKLTAVGKDERAISVSGYVYRGEVKIAQPAHDRVLTFKGTTRNHLLGQIFGFRIGDPKAKQREDDLLDTFCYGIAIALGNYEGF